MQRRAFVGVARDRVRPPGSQKGTVVRRFITAAVRRHVKRAERMKERGNTMMGNFLAAVAGVAAATLDKHEQQAKWVVYAIALSLLFVTFPLAFLGMSVYASANLISADWPQWQQYAVVLAAAVGWALVVVFGVDRTLLVMSDAVDPRNKFGVIAMLLVRFVLAFVLSSLVADEIILWRYRAPIAATAEQISLDDRNKAATQLNAIHGVSGKQQAVTSAQGTLDTLRAERGALPAAVVALQDAAKTCGRDRDALAQRYAALGAQTQADDALAPQLARLGQQLADKRRDCNRQLKEASDARATYLKEKDAAIADASTQLRDAATTLNQTQSRLNAEQTATSAVTSAAWRDGSSREAAFSRVKSERADIRRNALLLWLALLLMELLPMLIKLFARNNPVAVSIQEQLSSDCAQARMNTLQSQQSELLWATALQQSQADPEMLTQVAAMQAAGEPLRAFDQILRQAEAAHDRLQRQQKRGFAPADAAKALLDAQAAAFDRLAKAY